MPTYVYRCDTCDGQIEHWQPFEDDALTACPQNGECPQPGAGAVSRVVVGLRTRGFIGTQSTNPNMETFWETGDPSVFRKPAS